MLVHLQRSHLNPYSCIAQSETSFLAGQLHHATVRPRSPVTEAEDAAAAAAAAAAKKLT